MGTTVGTPTQPETPRKGWFARNWMWFIPSGCLTIIVLFAALIGGIFALVEGSIKNSDVYTQAMAHAQANPQVAEQIGLPLKSGWFISGSINESNDTGDANIAIPISGPKGKGTIHATAKRTAGQWQFETLGVTVEGQATSIDLMQ